MRHATLVRIAAWSLLTFCGVEQASADSILLALLQPAGDNAPQQHYVVEVLIGPSGPLAIQRQFARAGTAASRIVASPDGRHAAWVVNEAGGFRLARLDRRTGLISTVAIPATSSGVAVFSDPLVTRFYVVTPGTSANIIRIEGDTVSTIPIAGRLPVAMRGRELFVTRSVGTPTAPSFAVAVVDVETGSELRVLPNRWSVVPEAIAVSANGRRVAVTAGSFDPTVMLGDTETGEELARYAFPAFGTLQALPDAVFEDGTNRLFVRRTALSGSVGVSSGYHILNAATLAPITTATGFTNVAFDATQGLALTVGSFFSRFGGCGSGTVETWAAASTPLSRIDVALGGACPSGLWIAIPPAPVAAVSVQIQSSRVRLSWPAVPFANLYVIDVGTSPTVMNLLQLRTDATEFVAENVPSGTYWVQVRAVNDAGASAQSTGVAVVVP